MSPAGSRSWGWMVPDPPRTLSTVHAFFFDAMEWVELANALGLGQYVDGDLMASKANITCSCQSQSRGGACALNPRVAPQAHKLAQLENAECRAT